jgi:hypothetical protein
MIAKQRGAEQAVLGIFLGLAVATAERFPAPQRFYTPAELHGGATQHNESPYGHPAIHQGRVHVNVSSPFRPPI